MDASLCSVLQEVLSVSSEPVQILFPNIARHLCAALVLVKQAGEWRCFNGWPVLRSLPALAYNLQLIYEHGWAADSSWRRQLQIVLLAIRLLFNYLYLFVVLVSVGLHDEHSLVEVVEVRDQVLGDGAAVFHRCFVVDVATLVATKLIKIIIQFITLL